MTGPADLKRSFPPVADARTRVLVLGSLPGEMSLAQARYYAHPQNQFWRLIGGVVGVELHALPYDDRLAVLRSAGVGLWDVVGSASRRGSLDAAIRDHSANPLAEFVRTLPALRAVAFNGGKAAVLGARLLADAGLTLIRLPSSSPAHTAPFEGKRVQWLNLRAFLRDQGPSKS